MPEPKWIRFVDFGPTETGRTNVWVVRAKADNCALGLVKWFGRWRRYCFFPEPDSCYEQDCLRDIADFCERAMKARKEPPK